MDWMIDEPTDPNETRPSSLCAICGADHELEACAPGCPGDALEQTDQEAA